MEVVVPLPPLSERLADIPTIFNTMLVKALEQQNYPTGPTLELLNAIHYEDLMLHAFPKTNVRGLIDIADRIVSYIAVGAEPKTAINNVFAEQLGKKPSLLWKASKRGDPLRMTAEKGTKDMGDGQRYGGRTYKVNLLEF